MLSYRRTHEPRLSDPVEAGTGSAIEAAISQSPQRRHGFRRDDGAAGDRERREILGWICHALLATKSRE